MSLMQPLLKFSQSQPGLSATEALHQYTNLQNQNQLAGHQMPHHGMNPAMHSQQQMMNANLQIPPGQRTPNHFVSPANSAHLTLPGQTNAAPSPATLHGMSPAMQNLALQQQQQALQQQAPTSVGMVHSASQHGTNNSVGTGSQGPSANASPSMTNKRRRPSAVKGEDEGGGVEVNGVGPSSKVKPSPRIGGKRQKGNG